MEYTFSWGAVMFGFMILIGGSVTVLWHRQISDSIASGLASYDRVKLVGLIACAVGFLTMLNVHSLFLSLVASTLFGG